MKKLEPTECMIRLAELVADVIVIPDHCTLEWDDIFQEVCLIYLERGYTQTPGMLKSRVIDAINNYVNHYGCEIACGLLKEAVDYNIETAEVDAAISTVVATTVEKMFERLTPREEEVMRLHFGINCDTCNLAKAGAKLGVSRNRASQIEHRAIRKCRHPLLYQYIDLKDVIDMINSGEYFM